MQSLSIKDPIHGRMAFDAVEHAVVGTQVFQRLRGIRQLALTEFLFPRATHDRLQHSLGVAHVTGRVLAAADPDELAVARAAALLHDLGHGPFSHVTEQILVEQVRAAGRLEVKELHPLLSAQIIRRDPALNRALGSMAEDVAQVVEGSSHLKVASMTVSGPADADKLDYLVRDAHFTGQGDLFELAVLLLDEATSAPISRRVDIAPRIRQLRGTMRERVYWHHVRRATDIMLSRGLRFVLPEAIVAPNSFEAGRLELTNEFLDAFVELDDRSALALCRSAASAPARQMAERIDNRRLLQRRARVTITETLPRERILDPMCVDHAAIERLELGIVDDIGRRGSVEPWQIAINLESDTNPTYRLPAQPGDTANAEPEAWLYMPPEVAVTGQEATDLLVRALRSA
jgi:HD superfamily phosphohydrolase